MKIKKIIYSIFSIMALTVLLVNPVQVHADTVTSKIKATYSTNINPQTGDTFKITYKKKDESNENANSFNIDASTIVDNQQALKLPVGSYTILSIEYKGNNETIKKEGYAIEENFEAKDNPLTIMIAIGAEKRDEMLTQSLYVVTESGTNYNTYSDNKVNEGATAHSETTTIEETTTFINQQIATQNISNIDKEELTAEVYNKSPNKNNKGGLNLIIYKLLPILIIAIGGSLTIFILHKRGKF